MEDTEKDALDKTVKASGVEEGVVEGQHNVNLHRALKARHITMIGKLEYQLRSVANGLNSNWWCNWNGSDYWHGRSSCKVSCLVVVSDERNRLTCLGLAYAQPPFQYMVF